MAEEKIPEGLSQSWEGLWKNDGVNKVNWDLIGGLHREYLDCVVEKYAANEQIYTYLPNMGKRKFRVRCEMIIFDEEEKICVNRGGRF